MKKNLILLLAVTALVACRSQQKGALPLDPDVRYGKLNNGLTYYIRHNNLPENRADFYLVQKVGSMQEEDNQSGLAHFLEHMAFNGTENFPDKSMINYLEENGVKFGDDVNAYTSFDETVYNISNVPTTRESLLDSCLLILHDWSAAIALRDEEIDKERGVIEEEWRSGSGSQRRITEKVLSELLKGSKYAGRLPIGSMDVVKQFRYHELRDYYHKWYRPDLQGIVIVGNIDTEKVEQKIKEMFAHIKTDENRAERIYYPVPDNDTPIVSIVTDPEAAGTGVSIFFKHEPVSPEIKLTEELFAVEYIKTVVINLLNNRLFEITQQPNSPFISAEVSDGDFIVAKTKSAWTLSADCANDKVEESILALLRENERVKKFGFTTAEYERVRTQILQAYEDSYNNRNKVYNDTYVKECMSHFISDMPIPGIEQEYEIAKSVATRTSVKDINNAFKKLSGDKNIAISVTGPEVSEITGLDAKQLVLLLQKAVNEKMGTYDEEISNTTLMKTPPTPGKIVGEEENKVLGATMWTLSNGMKIVLKSTDFENNEILMSGVATGGFSHFAEKDPINSSLLSDVMTLDGVGHFSTVALDKVLSGKTVAAAPSIEMTTQSFSGSSSVRDFETMLQLVYLYFTSPRRNEEAFETYMQNMKAGMKNVDTDPSTIFEDSLSKTLYGNNPLFERLKPEDLEKIDYNRIEQMYKACFSHPCNFLFTFVGNIDKETAKPAILRYLGSLKGREENPAFVRLPMDIRTGSRKNIFRQEMKTPKASIYSAFTGKMERSRKNLTTMNILVQILEIVYTEKVREGESGSYEVNVDGVIARYPEEQTILSVQYETDPTKVEKLNKIIFDELRAISKEGPRQADFDKVKTFMNKSFSESVRSNGYWISVLSALYFYGEDFHGSYRKTLDSVTPQDVKEFVRKLLEQKNEAMVVMMPKQK